MSKELITVTSPLLPNLDDFHEELKKIWGSKWITNNGSYHKQLEAALVEYLGVPYVSLFTNGTLPLLTALQALRITGEVITTVNDGNACTFSVTYDLPEKVSPLPVLDKKNCDIVAFLHFVSEDDMHNNYLLNAGSLRYTDESLGITAPTVTPASPVCYDLQGRRIDNGVRQHGICIDSNGRKIVR